MPEKPDLRYALSPARQRIREAASEALERGLISATLWSQIFECTDREDLSFLAGRVLERELWSVLDV